MKIYFLVLVLIVTTESLDEQVTEVNKNTDDIPYITQDCESISGHESCHLCNSVVVPRGYHIDVDGSSSSGGGFCKMLDPNHGIEPGVVVYTASLYFDTERISAGSGIYFNYYDNNNFEMVYKIDFASFVCIVGYVEEGKSHNVTTFQCGQYERCESFAHQVQVSSDMVHYTGNMNSSTVIDTFSFKPHFPVVAKAGPLVANDFGNSYFKSTDIDMETKTCADEPDSPLCDPCVFAYNVQSVPEYPLPNYKNMLLWNARAMEMVYSACYMKVVVDVAEQQVVKVVSKVGQVSYEAQGPEEEDIKPGDLYGERNECSEKSAACVEVKYAGYVTDGSVQYMDKTLAEMRLDDSTSLTSSEVNRNLKLIYNEDLVKNTSHEFHMYIKEHVYGADFGIYCYTVQGSALTAQNYAYNMCAVGSNDPFIPPPEGGVNQNNWAVRFS